MYDIAIGSMKTYLRDLITIILHPLKQATTVSALRTASRTALPDGVLAYNAFIHAITVQYALKVLLGRVLRRE